MSNLTKELRKFALTGLGAAMTAKENAKGMTKKWLAKGEAMEPQIKKTVKRLVDQRKTLSKKASRVAAQADSRLKGFVKYIPVITRKDFTSLSKQMEQLTTIVNGLAKKKGR